MPLSRAGASQFTAELARLYRQAEDQIAEYMSSRLARGIETPAWAHTRRLELRSVRQWVTDLMGRVDQQGQVMASRSISRAVIAGRRSAVAEVRRQVASRPQTRGLLEGNGGIMGGPGILDALGGHQVPGHDRTAVLAARLSGQLERLHPIVVHQSVAAYRDVVDRASAAVTLGVQTQRQAATEAWSELVRQGFTKIQTPSGRRWSLDSYVDMASRTAVVQASVESHLSTLAENGIDLVQVSNAPAECSLCRPWEGKILLTGSDGHSGEHQVKRTHGIEDRAVTVTVAGTVAEARAAGLFHPNCRHSLGAYIPGVSSPLTNTADPRGAEARDKLRTLERQARAAKLAENTALDPVARAAARSRARQVSAKIGDHVRANPGLQRQTGRESINQGHGLLSGQERRQLAVTPPRAEPSRRAPAPVDPAAGSYAVPGGTGPLPNRSAPAIPTLLNQGTGSRADREAAQRGFGRAIDGTYGTKGLRAEVEDFETMADDEGTISGSIMDANGLRSGSFVRSFGVDDRGQRYAYHEYLKINGDNQGSGFAEEFNRNLYDWYRRSGISYVNVHANIDVGGYTWATQGFEFESAREYQAFADGLRFRLSQWEAGGGRVDWSGRPLTPISDDDLATLRQYLDDIDEGKVTASAYDLSQLGRKPGQAGRDATWPGKWAMLGSSWHGRLRL